MLLEKAIRKSEAVDRESLCIVAGEKVSRAHPVQNLASSHFVHHRAHHHPIAYRLYRSFICA